MSALDQISWLLARRPSLPRRSEPNGTTVTLGIRIPLATDSGNQPRIAAASAEFAFPRGEIQRLRLQAGAHDVETTARPISNPSTVAVKSWL